MQRKIRFTTPSNVKKFNTVAQSSSITRTSDSGMLYQLRSRMMAQACKGSSLAILSSPGYLRRRPRNRESLKKTLLTTMSCKLITSLQVILKSQTSRILKQSQLPSEGISESLKLQKKTPRTSQTNSVLIQRWANGSNMSPKPAGAPSTCSCTRMWKLEPLRKIKVDHKALNRIKAITRLILLQR